MWIKSEKSRKNQIKTDPFNKSFRKMLDNSTIHCYHNLIERDRSTLEKYFCFFFVFISFSLKTNFFYQVYVVYCSFCQCYSPLHHYFISLG